MLLEQAKRAKLSGSFDGWKGRIWIGGPSGSGKTQSIASFPPIYKGAIKPVLLIDYDGRYQTLSEYGWIKVISLFDPDQKTPVAWTRAETLRRELWALAKRNELPFSLVVEDGMTQMGAYAMNWALLLHEKRGLGGVPAEQHYLPQMKVFKDHVTSMKELPCHYILLGHLDLLENKADGTFTYQPKAIGKTARTELAGWFDETYSAYRFEAKKPGDPARYFWNTQGGFQMDFCKSSLNTLGSYWADPVRIDFAKTLTGFSYLIKQRFDWEMPSGVLEELSERLEKEELGLEKVKPIGPG